VKKNLNSVTYEQSEPFCGDGVPFV